MILSGDFNLAKDCDLYEYFFQQGKWLDPFRDDVSPTFHAEFLSTGRRPRRIDYIFAKGSSAPSVLEAHVMFDQRATLDNKAQTYLSNHKGLYAKLSFKG
jgi:endonuclease/exonuclease/phosphatase family metal-dependent hydrolase